MHALIFLNYLYTAMHIFINFEIWSKNKYFFMSSNLHNYINFANNASYKIC